MQIWKWLLLSVLFMVTSSYCNGLSLSLQKNQTEPLVSETLLSDVTETQQGQFENNTKAGGHKRARSFSGFRTPIDPLSRSFIKPKKDKKRQSKTPQTRPGQKDSVDQIIPRESSTLTFLRPGDASSVDKVQLGQSIPMQGKECNARTKPNGPTDSFTAERNPTEHVRTRVSKRRGQSGGFGLPIDRIGLGHLPHGKG